jgi:hypothetical protein
MAVQMLAVEEVLAVQQGLRVQQNLARPVVLAQAAQHRRSGHQDHAGDQRDQPGDLERDEQG